MPESTYFRIGSEPKPVVTLLGEWTLDHASELLKQSDGFKAAGKSSAVIDGSQLQSIDTTGALILFSHFLAKLGARDVQYQGFSEQKHQLLELVRENLQQPKELRERHLGLVRVVGRSVVNGWKSFLTLIQFIGGAVTEQSRLLVQPQLLRLKEFFVQLELVGLNAIPVVALVMLLIGVVVAYLFASQIEKYGANIFIVDAVSIAICRELSPVIVAIIIAGRSGSAFTAQLGAMKLNEEIDALVTLGLSPMRVLIIPRLFALVLTLPILVFVGDVVGILGGMLIADARLGVTSPTFITRLHDVLKLKHFLVGLGKAPVFAAFIAIIGCKMGLTVENNARSLGLNTTSTVVQSIVSVILINAAFAVMFVELGI